MIPQRLYRGQYIHHLNIFASTIRFINLTGNKETSYIKIKCHIRSCGKELLLRRPHPTYSLAWTKTLKALADVSRLKIIRELLKNDSSVTHLSKNLYIKIYNISRHLKILEAGGLVKKRKDGNNRIYIISDELMNRFSNKDKLLDLGCCTFTFKDLN